MTSSSGRPDARPGREPESASFETARVASRRGSPPVLVLGFLVVVGTFVAVGVGGQSSGQPTFPPVAIATPASSPTAAAATPRATTGPRLTPATPVPVMTTGPGPVQLQAQRLDSSMSVHGDVFVARVTWVFVSLQDATGRVAGWASVSVPGAAGPAQSGGPTLRFDVTITVPDSFSGPLRLYVNAYDDTGTLIGNAGLVVGPLVPARVAFEPQGQAVESPV